MMRIFKCSVTSKLPLVNIVTEHYVLNKKVSEPIIYPVVYVVYDDIDAFI